MPNFSNSILLNSYKFSTQRRIEPKVILSYDEIKDTLNIKSTDFVEKNSEILIDKVEDKENCDSIIVTETKNISKQFKKRLPPRLPTFLSKKLFIQKDIEKKTFKIDLNPNNFEEVFKDDLIDNKDFKDTEIKIISNHGIQNISEIDKHIQYKETINLQYKSDLIVLKDLKSELSIALLEKSDSIGMLLDLLENVQKRINDYCSNESKRKIEVEQFSNILKGVFENQIASEIGNF